MAPTELADTYLGNVNEQIDLALQVAQAKENGRCQEVIISRSDRPKGRILTRTAAGQSVGIVKGRDWLLRDGDVLATAQNYWVLVSIQQQQVMALRFKAEANNQAIALVHLGHVLGNRHWPVTVHGNTLYVELVADATLMVSTVQEMAKALSIEGLQVSFEERLSGGEAPPTSDSALDFSHAHHH